MSSAKWRPFCLSLNVLYTADGTYGRQAGLSQADCEQVYIEPITYTATFDTNAKIKHG